jgi:hypothetical protein
MTHRREYPIQEFSLHARRLLTRTGRSWGIFFFNASSKD